MISWHRFYDPSTGRYVSADPIGLDGGINLYAYVGGNPVNWFDPKGLSFGTGKDCSGCGNAPRLWGPSQCTQLCKKKWHCDKEYHWLPTPTRCAATILFCMVRCDKDPCTYYNDNPWGDN